MILFAVDDEKPALDYLVTVLKETYPQADIYAFSDTQKAIETAANIRCDVVFLDIRMNNMSGIELAKSLKDINNEINIVFTTGYPEYSLEAFRIYASDYLLKPVSTEAVKRAMDNLRNPILPKQENKLRIQCFGNFEVFSENKPVHFKRAKTKELFAYLIDRKGAACTMGELISILWENSPDTHSQRSNLRNLISDLKKTLADFDAESILIKERNTLAVKCESVICDYYDFLNQIPYAVNGYHGEYMAQYSWPELTLAALENHR